MLIGYVRVSTHDQNVDLQRNALLNAGCEKIFEDKVSGSKIDRPGLRKAIRCLGAGDSLLVWKLDRLGRSVKHLITLVGELQAREAHFRSLTDNIDTGTAMGRFFFHVMSALAEMERELIVERTKAGLQAAREQGRIGGRRPIFSPEERAQAGRLLANGYSRKLIANHYGIGISTMYRYFPASKTINSYHNQEY
ncbi:MAG: recombinase family protein [Enterobacteriaceae bacterium]